MKTFLTREDQTYFVKYFVETISPIQNFRTLSAKLEYFYTA